ncbi:MAG: hypothetical protein AAGD11_10575 [Planctomycetota bacterium]
MLRADLLFLLSCCCLSLGLTGCQRADELGPIASVASSTTIREALSSSSGGSSGGESATASGTGWATLKGRFVFDGTPPQMQPYSANKDMGTCAPGGSAPLQETVVVDSTGGLANVAIYVRKVSRVHETATSTESNQEFDQKECVFLSHVYPFVLGDTMVIKNSDPVGHNTNIEGKNGFNQTIPANSATEFTPQKEEAVPVGVACSIHPWMKSYFLPRKNGYVAVTKPDGSFEIPNLPAGEALEFQVWHESATGPGKALVLTTPAAKELKWSGKGRFKIKLAENEEKELEISVPAAALGG